MFFNKLSSIVYSLTNLFVYLHFEVEQIENIVAVVGSSSFLCRLLGEYCRFSTNFLAKLQAFTHKLQGRASGLANNLPFFFLPEIRKKKVYSPPKPCMK